MLAYVFWHYPRSGVDRNAYESSLRAFHAALKASEMRGFETCASFGVTGLSWINDAQPSYEDWYLVTDWEAFGRLNTVAVEGARKDPHDRAASAAAAGAGGVYAKHTERNGVFEATSAQWLSKPNEMSYEAFDALVAPALHDGSIVWQRMMVLGPGREFCITGPEPIALPAPLDVLTIERRVVA